VAMIARNQHATTNPAGWKYLFLDSKCYGQILFFYNSAESCLVVIV